MPSSFELLAAYELKMLLTAAKFIDAVEQPTVEKGRDWLSWYVHKYPQEDLAFELASQQVNPFYGAVDYEAAKGLLRAVMRTPEEYLSARSATKLVDTISSLILTRIEDMQEEFLWEGKYGVYYVTLDDNEECWVVETPDNMGGEEKRVYRL